MDHNSAALELFDEQKWVPVGHVSLNGKPAVKVGQLVEVRFLYWWKSALYQATFIRVRDDLDESAASMAQLQLKCRAGSGTGSGGGHEETEATPPAA